MSSGAAGPDNLDVSHEVSRMEHRRDVELAAVERTLSNKEDEHVPGLAWEPESAAREKALLNKVYWGLLPWMFLTGIFTYFDRANFSFAAPALKQDLGLANSGYGLASGGSPATLPFAELCEIRGRLVNKAKMMWHAFCRHSVCGLCSTSCSQQPCDLICGSKSLAANPDSSLGHHRSCTGSSERPECSHCP